MLFKATFQITESIVLSGATIEIPLGKATTSKAVISECADQPHNSQIIVTVEQEPPRKARADFEHVAVHGYSEGTYERSDGSVTGLGVTLCDTYQQFCDCLIAKLRRHAQHVARAIRWRYNCPINDEQIRKIAGSVEWSLDGATWHTLRRRKDGPIYFSSWAVPTYSPSVVAEIVDALASGSPEPLGHELYHEAVSHCTSNPRSALLIGMAAMEAAVKACIADLAPDAGRLIAHVQSPSMEKLLKEYLPTLAPRPPVSDAISPPHDKIIKTIKGATYNRNLLAHRGQMSMDPTKVTEFVRTVLRTVHWVLWTMDYYRGNTWAKQYMDETLKTCLR